MRRSAGHCKRRATPLATKSARPSRVGHIGPPGALRRLPAIWESGGPASRRAPRLPGGPMCPMKRVNINDLWYKAEKREAAAERAHTGKSLDGKKLD